MPEEKRVCEEKEERQARSEKKREARKKNGFIFCVEEGRTQKAPAKARWEKAERKRMR